MSGIKKEKAPFLSYSRMTVPFGNAKVSENFPQKQIRVFYERKMAVKFIVKFLLRLEKLREAILRKILRPFYVSKK